jgi:hypothetical protein
MCGSCYYLLLVSSHKHEKQKDQRGRGERRSMLLKTKNPSFIIRSYIYLLQAYYKSQAPRCCIQVILNTCIIRMYCALFYLHYSYCAFILYAWNFSPQHALDLNNVV